MDKLCSRWGREVPDVPLQEYPRPQMVRKQYEILNGTWSYAITEDRQFPEKYQGHILVPFSPECALSGVERVLQPGEYLHYQRTFWAEPVKGERLLLHFEAVDQRCAVYVNRSLAGTHEGGYLAFTIEITSYVQEGENQLEVVVQDDSDTSYHARGKQKLKRGGMWYQAQSGIWQTVWMERVPKDYIEALKITPRFDTGEIQIKVFADDRSFHPVEGVISFAGAEIAKVQGAAGENIRVKLPNVFPWSPEQPNLYDLHLSMGEDQVESYFAMRKFSVERDEKGILRFFLNGQPYFHNGLLDQGYWPESLLTPPSEEALIYDIRRMKELGYNMLRKHIKIEPARWYYHCDKIGMLVWQDMINGGTEYHMKFVCTLPNLWMWSGRQIRDDKYTAFARQDQAGRQEYFRELKGMIKQLYHFPSIAAWVPFNEGWGQFDAAKASSLVAAWDHTRLIDEASGWFDQGGGDMYSIHNYWRPLKVSPKDRVVALTEYGGYTWKVEGHTSYDKLYSYKDYRSQEELTDGYKKLMERDILPNLKNGLSAAVYTQLSDVEEEVNGVLTYDREITKLCEEEVQALNRRIYQEFERCVRDHKTEEE